MDKTEEAIRRAEEARQIVEHPLLVEAFATAEQQLFEGWLGTREADHEGRERIYRMVWSLRAAPRFLAGVIGDGKVAAARLEALKRERAASEPPKDDEEDDSLGAIRTYRPGDVL